MEPLATAADLATATGLPETDANLVLALKRASGRFRLAAGHSVSQVEDDEVWISGTGSPVLLLPGAPVTDISVTLAGVVLVEGTDYRVGRRAGYIERTGGWPAGTENVHVTFTHGWPAATLPEGVADAVLEHATTLALSYAHVGQETNGNNTIGHNQTATVGVTQKWVDAVEACKLIRGRA